MSSLRIPGDRNLTFGLVESLGRAIVAGKFDSKSFPTEGELVSQHGTSRSVTREAVKMLTAKGLLRARPRQGTSVTSESQWNLLDPDVLRWLLERKFSLSLLKEFTEMRLAIEPAAVALVASRVDAATLARIEASLERMRAADRGEGDAVEADIAFHTDLLGASGNRFFANLDQLVNTALRISIRFTNSIKGRSASIPQHEEVLDAVRARDGERAAAAMRSLIQDVMQLISAAARRSSNPIKSKAQHRRA